MAELMIKDNNYCFACGKDNEQGLRLEVVHGDGAAQTELILRPEHQGWVDIAHGGIVSTILDEMMAHAIYTRLEQFVTAEITVRYKKAVPIGRPLVAKGEITETNKRRIMARAELRLKETNDLLATAHSKFLIVKK